MVHMVMMARVRSPSFSGRTCTSAQDATRSADRQAATTFTRNSSVSTCALTSEAGNVARQFSVNPSVQHNHLSPQARRSVSAMQ